MTTQHIYIYIFLSLFVIPRIELRHCCSGVADLTLTSITRRPQRLVIWCPFMLYIYIYPVCLSCPLPPFFFSSLYYSPEPPSFALLYSLPCTHLGRQQCKNVIVKGVAWGEYVSAGLVQSLFCRIRLQSLSFFLVPRFFRLLYCVQLSSPSLLLHP